MALPKEPRQKMINMMYLVLTALLALNVSAEILNAFRTVNNSISTANGVIDAKNKTVYESFDALAKDPQTEANAKKWQPLAQEAQKLSADMNTYLDGLKLTLKQESGLHQVDGVEEFKEDNIDAPSRLFDTKGEGPKLQQKLTEFKTNLLNVLDPSKFPGETALQKEITEEKERLTKTLPLDLAIPASHSGNSSNNWTQAYFHMTPTIAALTILSKFQNDVKNSESQVADYCLSKVGSVKVIFNKFDAIVGTNSTYLMPGQELEISAGIGAYSDAVKPTVTINGAVVPLNSDGRAIFKKQVSGVGEQSVAVHVNYTKPDGTQGVSDRVIKYTVGQPSGASVFLEKMNVMYIGVENPLMVSAGSAGKEKMSVSFTGGSITSAGGDRYVAKPTQAGPAEVRVTVEGKTSTFPMRCKILPDPTAMVGTNKGGSISSALFKAQGGMFARLLESEFDVKFEVLSYKLGANGGAFGTYQEAANEGPRWTGKASDIVTRATPGSSIFFDQIRVKGPDGKVRELPGIFFNLK
ncbi:type IX secretion system motor protein PorM/GldM [Pinibacter aurantiacus]|uniref:Gliding motility protein GldM n=1 Tax=Pinibacter aurantiacus TaxID=2851599 RepID=A0A9E2SDK5_9BACT|nr:gliding motility protein GldM [Pinibacter aurantiacus]MBV4357940.1 gliding motility protein GldM [Pinibacter aurantiacus]